MHTTDAPEVGTRQRIGTATQPAAATPTDTGPDPTHDDGVGAFAAPLDQPPMHRERADRLVAPLATGGILAAASVAVLVADPGDGGTPVCLSKVLFGIDCPFCGGLRAANSLLRGHWLAAADHNVVLAVALPVAALVWALWTIQSLRGHELRLPRIPRPVLWVGVGLLIAFTVLRNLDVGSGWIHWLASGTA